MLTQLDFKSLSLYKTSKLGSDKPRHEDKDDRWRSFYRSLEDLSLLFLSPLLAIAIWFVLSQWTPTQGRNNIYILGAVSFTVGLVTDEIVVFLIKLTQSILRVAQKEEEKPVEENQQHKKKKPVEENQQHKKE